MYRGAIWLIDVISDVICRVNVLFGIPYYTVEYIKQVPSLLNKDRVCNILELKLS